MKFNPRSFICLAGISLLFFSPLMGQTPPSPATASQSQTGFVAPQDVSVALGSDIRLFAVMAALNLAGYDYEPAGRTMTDLRSRLRNELQPDPGLINRLQSFYRSKRKLNIDEPSQAAPYVALAFAMNKPPELDLAIPPDRLPPDVRAVADFAALAGELFRRTNIAAIAPKYAPEFDKIATTYYKPIGEMIFQVLAYLHTRPVTFVAASGAPIVKDKKGNTIGPLIKEKDRTRRMFVIVDPLSAHDTVFVRNDLINMFGLKDRLDTRVGDDYIVVVGPSDQPNMAEIKRTFLRFALDPIVEHFVNELFDPATKKPTGLTQNILNLTKQSQNIDPQLKDNVSVIVRESMVYAAEAGMARMNNREPLRGPIIDEDNQYNLSKQFDRGAVLAFHFYEKFKGLEESGIDLRDLYQTFITAVNFDVEQKRTEGFAALRAKVEARRAAERTKEIVALPGVDKATADNLDQADLMIRRGQFPQASAILNQILTNQPTNARALFGMAEITSQQPSAVEAAPKSDNDDKLVAQEERLGKALILFRQAIAAASPQYELWIKSRAHVAMGRILDFTDHREAAIAEYEEAVKIGDVPNGAYKEAAQGKDHPLLPRSGKPQ
ncbi:MAG TPA: hypothetical protein VFC63_18395 [Blastocatellia bacterium]|nr:hypothetical protein [Blastocatellia bacterium]